MYSSNQEKACAAVCQVINGVAALVHALDPALRAMAVMAGKKLVEKMNDWSQPGCECPPPA